MLVAHQRTVLSTWVQSVCIYIDWQQAFSDVLFYQALSRYKVHLIALVSQLAASPLALLTWMVTPVNHSPLRPFKILTYPFRSQFAQLLLGQLQHCSDVSVLECAVL